MLQVTSIHPWSVNTEGGRAAEVRKSTAHTANRVRVLSSSFLSSPEPMKLALSIEAKAWKMLLCRYLNEEYKKKMSDMITFINEYLKKLSRPIRDLDDVRFAMEALSCIRDNEIQMDMTLGPIEVRNGCILLS